MFHHLTLAVRDRIIKEFREYWADHPRYPDLAQNIQGKYSFEERPQFGMVIKTGGASNVVLSNDNYMGIIEGYVSLAQVPPYKGKSIEWVRDDMMKTPEEGVYIVSIIEPTVEVEDPYIKYAVIQKYRRVHETSLMFSTPTEISLLGEPIANSLRLIEYPSGRLLSSSEYTLEGSTVTLTEALPSSKLRLEARYTEQDAQTGPYAVQPALAYRNLINGVVVAFGRELEAGDKMAVLVEGTRTQVSKEYGGRWDISVDVDLVTRDVHSQADIADKTVVWLWSILRPKLSTMGLELSNVSLGGEGEEAYDDNGDDYFYTASISFSIQADWFIHYPLVIPILSVSTQNVVPMQLLPMGAPIVGVGNTDSFRQRIIG
jgi:hypothetical protein